MNIEREMATIRRVTNIKAIPEADNIELAYIDGWQVVVKKGEFKPGDLAVYCEIDSWVPDNIAPFLKKPGQAAKEYNGVEGQRLRTIRLRGCLSQGLLLPLSVVYDHEPELVATEDDDVSALLNVQKWERPIGNGSASLGGSPKGSFPAFLRRTDQERIQNCYKWYKTEEGSFETTEKLDGSSMTAYLSNGTFGVCSRNIDLKEEEGNAFWEAARKYRLEELIQAVSWPSADIALQGELIGPGIQGNPYKLTERRFYLFDIFNIQDQSYFEPRHRQELAKNLGLWHVPILSDEEIGDLSLEQIILKAEGKSEINPEVEREGVVWKRHEKYTNDQMSFKAISNKWLLRQRD